MKRIYFDYAASTPVDPAVEKAMKPYFSEKFGNPGSLHRFGQEAEAAVFKARRAIAGAVGADHREIIFTGSATESNNIALRGITRNYAEIFRVSPREVSVIPRPRIIISAVEHESVLETCRDLEKEGVEIIYIPVSKEGIVDVAKIKKALNENTILVSVMYANNEIGTIQPITEIAKAISEFRKQKIESRSSNKKNSKFYFLDSRFPFFHTDAVQAFQYLDCDVNKLGVDFMTLSAHKIYGPKGIGALYVRDLTAKSYKLKAVITGGGQESGLRSGTPNVPFIAGFGEAVKIAADIRKKETDRIKKLRDYFWSGLKKINPKLKLNGSEKNRLPNNLNIYFPGQSAADLLIKLDLAGVAVSPGAACSARAARPSYVLEALGLSHNRCNESLRITLGRPTTKAEIDRALAVFRKIFKSPRQYF